MIFIGGQSEEEPKRTGKGLNVGEIVYRFLLKPSNEGKKILVT